MLNPLFNNIFLSSLFLWNSLTLISPFPIWKLHFQSIKIQFSNWTFPAEHILVPWLLPTLLCFPTLSPFQAANSFAKWNWCKCDATRRDSPYKWQTESANFHATCAKCQTTCTCVCVFECVWVCVSVCLCICLAATHSFAAAWAPFVRPRQVGNVRSPRGKNRENYAAILLRGKHFHAAFMEKFCMRIGDAAGKG